MLGRESACNEWESRLHTVEERYSDEFNKMTDEVRRGTKKTFKSNQAR